MKKLLGIIVASLMLVNSIFAFNFFNDRFLEIKADVPFGLSNNVFAAGDYLKENLTINLRKDIADRIPETGWSTIIKTNPEVGLKLNIAAFSMGVNAGADVFAKINLDQGLFNFLFKGYEAGETLKVEVKDPVLDTFVYAEVPIGLKLKKFTLNVTPAVFYPVAILDNCNIVATAVNDSEGNVTADVNADVNLYTTSLVGPMLDENFSAQTDINAMIPNLGFDVAAHFRMPLTKRLGFSVDGRFPLMPAKLDAKLNVKTSMHIDGNIMGMALENKQFNQVMTDPVMNTTMLDELYKINRPLKLSGYFDYNFFGFLKFKAGGGFAVRRVGSESAFGYPEYYASTTLSLFEMIKTTLSTEYTDLLFKHQLEAVVNLRFVEVDLGVSLEASNFLRSFEIAGFGAHVGVVVGL